MKKDLQIYEEKLTIYSDNERFEHTPIVTLITLITSR